MSEAVGKLVNHPWLLNMLGRLGIRASLWRTYCRWFGPEGGIIQLDLDRYHARFYVHSEWVAEDLKTFGRGEKDLLLRLMGMMKPGDVVFDVGANMGLHTVFLANAVGPEGRILAFEPEPHYCERLSSNLGLNGLSNVRIIPVALGEKSCTSELLPPVPGLASPRLAGTAPATHSSSGSLKVQVIEGDRLVEIEKLPPPKLVKVDVEGFEYAVLRGLERTLTNPACRVVCCEVHSKLLPEGVDPKDILNILKSCGFTRFDILPRPPDQHVLAFKE